MLETCIVCGTLKGALFCGKANSFVLFFSFFKKRPTVFDLEYLKQKLDREAERRDEGSRRKDRLTSMQEDRNKTY